MHYILRRIGFYLIAAWASITLNFFLPRLMPGDPATRDLRPVSGPDAPRRNRRDEEGVWAFSDDPLIVQYFTYLTHLFRGISASVSAFPAPVTEIIGQSLVGPCCWVRRRCC